MEFRSCKKPECYSPGRTKSYAEIAENDCFTCLERATCLDFGRDTVILKQFLDILDKDIETNPQNIKPITEPLVGKLGDLVGDIEIDPDAPLVDDCEVDIPGEDLPYPHLQYHPPHLPQPPITMKEPTSLKEPIEILLRVLLAGNTVTDVSGEEYGMDDEGHLLIKVNRSHPKYAPNKDPEPIWLQVPCDISELKTIADRIGNDTLWLKACGIPLRSQI